MNLAHFLQNIELAFPGTLTDGDITIPYLTGKKLNNPIFLDVIRRLDEFKKCNSIDVVDFPVGPTWETKTTLIRKGCVFTGDIKLYSIITSPSVYSFSDMSTPVKDLSLITPLMYSPSTFAPYKSIVMRIENDFDIPFEEMFRDQDVRQDLHSRLEKIMNNHKLYESKGHKCIMVRADFTHAKEESDISADPLELYL